MKEVDYMGFKDLLLGRLQQIAHSVRESQHALALLALGSAGAESYRMDQYSDLDFFVICEKGFKESFISDLSWLKQVAPIAYLFKNTNDGYKLLFEDGVFCEFAVFEHEEVKDIQFTEGKIIWKREGFDSSVCETQRLPAEKALDLEWVLGEAMTNLYVGLCRYHRGERLSAYYFIQNYALQRILELITLVETPLDIKKDIFSISRRFEFRYPEKSKLLSRMIAGYNDTLNSAGEMIAFLDANFTINQVMKSKILELCIGGC